MMLQQGETFELRDGKQRMLGHVLLETVTADLVTGRFQPGPDHATVESLFREFEAAADSQALAAVDKADAAIAALGLSLSSPGDNGCFGIRDVQIWSDGGFSCRLGRADGCNLNGAQATKITPQGTR